MRWLKTVVQLLCLLPLITGAMDLVLHHDGFDGGSLNRVASGQPIQRRMTSDAQEKISHHAQ